jgi:DNA-binding MarR family transcriptional regulator
LRTSGETVDRAAQLSDAELRAWSGILQAHALVGRRLEVALQERHRLSLAEYTVLDRLWTAAGSLRMSDLAGSALLSPSGVSRLVDRLVAEGLLERTTSGDDGRAILAVLTQSGERRRGEAATTHAEELRGAFLAVYSPDELGVLGELLHRACGEPER